jgi:hypothetical protein
MGLEEQIWEYIDGTCTEAERKEIEIKIIQDRSFKKVYEELVAIHQFMEVADLEEPSMSFNRNVMEQVNLEISPISLKTRVDNRIIYSISAFFMVSLFSLLVYVVLNTPFESLHNIDFKMPDFNFSAHINIDSAATKTGLQAFFFIDIILGLVYLDRLLRKKLRD